MRESQCRDLPARPREEGRGEPHQCLGVRTHEFGECAFVIIRRVPELVWVQLEAQVLRTETRHPELVPSGYVAEHSDPLDIR
jgi:hypothetical protein